MRRHSSAFPRLLVLLALLFFAGGVRAADNWADLAGDDPDFAASTALCKKAKAVTLPPQPGPAAKDCDSSALLYGIDRPVDPAAARACAAREMREDGDNPAVGAATLATMYANGTGVPRDLDVAIAYACLINGAPVEMQGRLKHLAELKAKGPGAKPFDICDDATSGAMEGFCAERDGDVANAKRKVELAKLADRMTGASRAAFDKLRQAEQAFVKASSDNEVDMSGTARGMLIVGSQQGHEEAFMATLRGVLAGKLESVSRAGETDKRLNTTYAKVMALKDTSGLGTVDKKDIKATQRVWLAYRDAFLAFAKVVAPTVPADTLAATLTDARTKDLAAFLQS